jgi:TonB family protein
MLATPVVALVTSPVPGQDANDTVSDAYVAARPLERPAPSYPVFASQDRKEGWVVVSFVVSPTGEVGQTMIEDSSGVEDFERSALRAVSKWRYSPALRDGAPVEQAMVTTRILFRQDRSEKGATPAFQRDYKKILGLINAHDLANADGLLEELEAHGRSNLYEDAWFWWLKFMYLDAAKIEDRAKRRHALRLAIGYEEDYLPADVFVAAARRLYALEIDSNDLSAARRVFLRLRDSKTARTSQYYEPAMAVLTPHFERVQQAISGNDVLAVIGTIDDHDYWVHQLLRRSFSLSDVKGRIDVVDIRCSRGTKRYESFAKDAVWNIPASWGDCGVYIKGGHGANFVFEERPTSAGDAK